MSETPDVALALLKNDVDGLKSDVRAIKGDLSPLRDKQNEQNHQITRMVEGMAELTASAKKTSEKVDNILDDFHDSLLKQAEARQFWTWIKSNGPPFLTLLISGAAAVALVRAAFLAWLGIP